ncbi:ABC transporter substrate-binding protein [Jiella endophytica]|uniref:ABC transporter substrate-binding protein n=1 Tax=Jiella endophytica TaxID=2558362 RepID=A0A4Y8RCA7_9HYPH|nr:TRAP transporter substrate-binding protein [Jiella endophytica]TFF19688.1 ABC transporter substrate-binding protein [Jiella endophytica]
MDRRKFIRGVASGAAGLGAASSLAAPALAQDKPKIQWRCVSSFPRSLPALFGASEYIARYVGEMTDGAFEIQPFAAGEIVPGGQVLDAVQSDTVEMGHTAAYYYVGKDPTFAFGTTVPFMLNARQQNAWFYRGGGNELLDKFFEKQGIFARPAGNTGAQMGGWYRKEINSLADMKGLKMRIAGLAGEVMAKLGVVPQQIPAGDIYAALEKGTLDAVEFVGPYDDEKLGFVKVAPYYYYPAWWEGGAATHAMISLDKWNDLPKPYQAVLKAACEAANGNMLATYDWENPKAIRSLVGSGAQLRPFGQEIMQASFKAAGEVMTDISARNADFKTLYDSQTGFRRESYLWDQLAEYNFDTFMMIQQRQGAI